jgi:hypothetical protein
MPEFLFEGRGGDLQQSQPSSHELMGTERGN